jgi:gas vesicle protein
MGSPQICEDHTSCVAQVRAGREDHFHLGKWLKACHDHPGCLVRGQNGIETHEPGPLRFDDLHLTLYAAELHLNEEKQRALQLVAEAEATRERIAPVIKAAKQSVGDLESIRQECERRLDDVRRSIQGATERLKSEIERLERSRATMGQQP